MENYKRKIRKSVKIKYWNRKTIRSYGNTNFCYISNPVNISIFYLLTIYYLLLFTKFFSPFVFVILSTVPQRPSSSLSPPITCLHPVHPRFDRSSSHYHLKKSWLELKICLHVIIQNQYNYDKRSGNYMCSWLIICAK